MTGYRRKLIEVAIPLDSINSAAEYEKKPGIGAHPRGLHHWWARRPFSTARAVIFSQLVDDPSSLPEEFPTRKEQDAERHRLFDLLEKLSRWENRAAPEIIEAARKEIQKSWQRFLDDRGLGRQELPPLYDPFTGGGAIPFEASRLGLHAMASDLNPVAVLMNTAMLEIPSAFPDRAPVGAGLGGGSLVPTRWAGADGLAEDVRRFGALVLDRVRQSCGHLYPPATVTKRMAKQREELASYADKALPVIAYIWTRTVNSPDPAFSATVVPLLPSFVLSQKKGIGTYVDPEIEGGAYRLRLRTGPIPSSAKNGTKLGRGASFRCILSGSPIDPAYVKREAMAGRLGAVLVAVVCQGNRERVYLEPAEEQVSTATSVHGSWKPEARMAENPRWFSPPDYGMPSFGDVFTDRQLVVLDAICDAIATIRQDVQEAAHTSGQFADDAANLVAGGRGSLAYGEAIATFLALALSRATNFNNTLAVWAPSNEKVMFLFNRQAIPMTWSFGEANMLGDVVGGFGTICNYIAACVEELSPGPPARVFMSDAAALPDSSLRIISTDPPYYDNIGYADLSDFFYPWLRRCLRETFPKLFATISVPKAEELIADPYRHGGKAAAEDFFLTGITRVAERLRELAHPAFPITIYYAFRQAEKKKEGLSSTGWETFLEGLHRAGLSISGTWPVRTESLIALKKDINALASSIVLACRKRDDHAGRVSRRDFIRRLKSALPPALRMLQEASIAPVDLAQAAIGPGMAVFSEYSEVVESDGSPMRVSTALALINEELDQVLAEQEGELDADTRWAMAWFEQHGYEAGPYGEADNLSRAKNTSVDGLVEAGVVQAGAGKVRLLRREELDASWSAQADSRLTIWEVIQHLVRRLGDEGEHAAARILREPEVATDAAKDLAYRLYVMCERKRWAEEAQTYNGLVLAWPELQRLASGNEETGGPAPQAALFE